MPRIIVLLYAIITGTIAVVCTIIESQPALFFIDFFAPNEGDMYSATLVMLLVWILLLTPLLVFMVTVRLMRKKVDKNISYDRKGIFITRQKSFQSAMVGIPIYINDKKVGIVDNGGTKFFDAPAEMFTVRAGYGKQASDKLQVNITERKQLHFEIKIKQAGFFLKIVLSQM